MNCWNKATSGNNGQTHLLCVAGRKKKAKDMVQLGSGFINLTQLGCISAKKSHSEAHEPVLGCFCFSKPLFAFDCPGSADARLTSARMRRKLEEGVLFSP